MSQLRGTRNSGDFSSSKQQTPRKKTQAPNHRHSPMKARKQFKRRRSNNQTDREPKQKQSFSNDVLDQMTPERKKQKKKSTKKKEKKIVFTEQVKLTASQQMKRLNNLQTINNIKMILNESNDRISPFKSRPSSRVKESNQKSPLS